MMCGFSRMAGVVFLSVVMVLLFAQNAMPAEAATRNFEANPYDIQVAEKANELASPSEEVRASAAEAIGFLRAYSAADELVRILDDYSSIVRREAVMSLGWCGGREHVAPLLERLEDDDWVVRQAACVALTNITSMEFEFDALAERHVQKEQVDRWRKWWSKVRDDSAPAEVFELAKE